MPKIVKDFPRFPKISNEFKTFFLDAVVSGPGESSGGNQKVQEPHRFVNLENENYNIPPGSEIYLRMPDDLVHKGILTPPLQGQPPGLKSLTVDQALVKGPNNHILIASLQFNAFYHNNYYRECNCYIKTSNNTIFAAKLEPYNYQQVPNVPNRIFVRIQGYNNPLFTGSLQRNTGYTSYLPVWLRTKY